MLAFIVSMLFYKLKKEVNFMCKINVNDDVMQYFFERYENCGFKVLVGHWPDFKSKEEVDEWIKFTDKLFDTYYDE